MKPYLVELFVDGKRMAHAYSHDCVFAVGIVAGITTAGLKAAGDQQAEEKLQAALTDALQNTAVAREAIQ